MSGDPKLKSIVDRIERLEEEQRGIGSDKRDIFTEAKSAGYNAKALRRLISQRKQKDADEIESDIETYRAALGMPKATYRSVAEQLGVSKTKLQRLVPREEKGTTESCGGTLSDRASETLEATVSEGSTVLTFDDAGTASAASLGPSLTDVASRCEPGPQDDLSIPAHLDRRKQVSA